MPTWPPPSNTAATTTRAAAACFRGRMTVALVAAGAIAKKLLPDVSFATRLTEIGGESDPARFDELLAELRRRGDSAGGIVEVVARGVARGVGEPFFDSVESVAAHLLFSIPGVKGVEFGAGFEAARRTGSANNDRIADGSGHTFTNNDGGINGGIANGNDIRLRVAFKPTPSIALPQETFDARTGTTAPLTVEAATTPASPCGVPSSPKRPWPSRWPTCRSAGHSCTQPEPPPHPLQAKESEESLCVSIKIIKFAG